MCGGAGAGGGRKRESKRYHATPKPNLPKCNFSFCSSVKGCGGGAACGGGRKVCVCGGGGRVASLVLGRWQVGNEISLHQMQPGREGRGRPSHSSPPPPMFCQAKMCKSKNKKAKYTKCVSQKCNQPKMHVQANTKNLICLSSDLKPERQNVIMSQVESVFFLFQSRRERQAGRKEQPSSMPSGRSAR